MKKTNRIKILLTTAGLIFLFFNAANAQEPANAAALIKADRIYQQAMAAESNGENAEACFLYQNILDLNEPLDGGTEVMVRMGLQRCFEKLQDNENEKIQLRWLHDNLLFPMGKYHGFLAVIPERAAKWIKFRKKKLLGEDKLIASLQDEMRKQGQEPPAILRAGNRILVQPADESRK